MSVTGVLVHSLTFTVPRLIRLTPPASLSLGSAISNLEASASGLDPRILGLSSEKFLH
jgi:hypothetical protein